MSRTVVLTSRDRGTLLIASMILNCFAHWMISPTKNEPKPTRNSTSTNENTMAPSSLSMIESTSADSKITSIDAYPINVAAPIMPIPSAKISMFIDEIVSTHRLKELSTKKEMEQDLAPWSYWWFFRTYLREVVRRAGFDIVCDKTS